MLAKAMRELLLRPFDEMMAMAVVLVVMRWACM